MTASMYRSRPWEVSICTCDDGDQAPAVDAGGDLLGRGGAGEARGTLAVEPPHQAADSDDTVLMYYGTRRLVATECQYLNTTHNNWRKR
jgi:hypothetical protein